MPTMPVVSWEMVAKDVKRQAAFYTELFGWTFQFDDSGLAAAVTTGGLDGSAVQADPPASDIYLYVQVPNMQAVLDKVPASGGSIAHPATGPEGGATAFITDPEGIVWGLTQEMQETPANP